MGGMLPGTQTKTSDLPNLIKAHLFHIKHHNWSTFENSSEPEIFSAFLTPSPPFLSLSFLPSRPPSLLSLHPSLHTLPLSSPLSLSPSLPSSPSLILNLFLSLISSSFFSLPPFSHSPPPPSLPPSLPPFLPLPRTHTHMATYKFKPHNFSYCSRKYVWF